MTTYYVNSSTGADTNKGTSAEPWKTLNRARNGIAAGDTVIIAGTFSESVIVNKPGTTWKAAAPGAAVIDGRWGRWWGCWHFLR